MPPIAKLSLPGRAFAYAISDLRSPGGSAALPTSRLGTVAIMVSGVKSWTGSNGGFG